MMNSKRSSRDGLSEIADTSHAKLFLKVKPSNTTNLDDEHSMYSIVNSSTLIAKIPSTEGQCRRSKKPATPEITRKRYTFTEIFPPERSGQYIFDQVAKQEILSFLGGRNSTILAYGTSNSGKTFTFFGDVSSPGLIPRSLELIFSVINCTEIPFYKPSCDGSVVSLSEEDQLHESESKESFLTSNTYNKSRCSLMYDCLDSPFVKEDDPEEDCTNNESLYSVWVSCAEIYNEAIRDLLADSEDNDRQQRELKLIADKQGNVMIRGLKWMCAASGLEAYQLIITGRSRATTAATSLNVESSRSHCIYAVKLLKYYRESNPEDVEISSLTFCDLAGSGRLGNNKVPADAARTAEACSINNSLLVLGKCLKAVCDNQTRQSAAGDNQIIGPFRESKLTRLFQKALSNREGIVILVNLDTTPTLATESYSILKSVACVGKRVLMEDATGRGSKADSMTEILLETPKSERSWYVATDRSFVQSPNLTYSLKYDEYEELKEKYEKVVLELEEMKKSRDDREISIGREMAEQYLAMMRNYESNWRQESSKVAELEGREMLEWSVERLEDFYRSKIDNLNLRKRRRITSCGGDSSFVADSEELLELENENVELKRQVNLLRESVKKLQGDRREIATEKNKSLFELSVSSERLSEIESYVKSISRDGKFTSRETSDAKTPLDLIKHVVLDKDNRIRQLEVNSQQKDNEFVRLKSKIVVSDEQINKLRQTVETLQEDVESRRRHIAKLESKIEFQSNALQSARFFQQANDGGLTSVIGIDQSTSMTGSLADVADCCTPRLSSSAKNNETRCIQTDSVIVIEEDEFQQLKRDFASTQAKHLSELERIMELDGELRRTEESLAKLKESASSGEQKLIECRGQLAATEEELRRANADKCEAEAMLVDVSRCCKIKIAQLERELMVGDGSNCPESYPDKCAASLESKASLGGQPDEGNAKCCCREYRKIDELEREVFAKSARVKELDRRLSRSRQELSRYSRDSSSGIKPLEQQQLQWRPRRKSKSPSAQREIIDKLTAQVHRKENEVLMLKAEVDIVSSSNTEGDFRQIVSNSHDRIIKVKRNVQTVELETRHRQEIQALKEHLRYFERNLRPYKQIQRANDNQRREIRELRDKLREKECELFALQRNKYVTLRKYKSLVDQLQRSLEIEKKHSSATLLRAISNKREVVGVAEQLEGSSGIDEVETINKTRQVYRRVFAPPGESSSAAELSPPPPTKNYTPKTYSLSSDYETSIINDQEQSSECQSCSNISNDSSSDGESISSSSIHQEIRNVMRAENNDNEFHHVDDICTCDRNSQTWSSKDLSNSYYRYEEL